MLEFDRVAAKRHEREHESDEAHGEEGSKVRGLHLLERSRSIGACQRRYIFLTIARLREGPGDPQNLPLRTCLLALPTDLPPPPTTLPIVPTTFPM